MPGAREKIEHHAARLLASLPASVQVRLSGRGPVIVDGNTLAPEIQLSLALMARRRERSPETLPLEQARSSRRQMAAVYGGEGDPVRGCRNLTLDTEVPLRARHYAPFSDGVSLAGQEPALLVYYHGGGFTYGDLDTHDALCRLLCLHTGAHLLSIDYRLAPEHPFPAAVEDASEALRWAFENASALGANPELIGVGGDSAGGNLAAVVSQMAARGQAPAPSLQLLIYPALDFTVKRRSRQLFGEGYLLSESEIQWFEGNYFGEQLWQAEDPRASPLLAPDLSGLPPAIVITAGFDPLRDEGEEYAQALQDAGNAVLLRRFPSFIHAFTGGVGVSGKSREAVAEIAGMTRALFALVAAQQQAKGAHTAS